MSRTLSVFEHQTVRVARDATGIGAPSLSEAEFQALVRFNDASGGRYFTVGHRSITFRQFVGYVQVGNLGIEILPKADRGQGDEPDEWRDVLLEMLQASLSIELHLQEDAAQSFEKTSLIRLLVASFVSRVEIISREGLARGYRSEEENGTTFRGKLCVAEHVRRNHSRYDRVYVRYATYDRDVPINRCLRAALDVAARAPIPASLRARVTAAARSFEDVAGLAPSSASFERLMRSLGRSTERYRDALVLARLLLDALSPSLRAGAVDVLALLFDVNVLWERYIAAQVRRAGHGRLQVLLQSSQPFWVRDGGASRPVRPDIVLAERRADGIAAGKPPRIVAVLDTKWKLVDSGGPADEDLKQMFVYHHVFRAPRSVLLVPATEPKLRKISGRFAGCDYHCEVVELALGHDGKTRSRAIVTQLEELLARLLWSRAAPAA